MLKLKGMSEQQIIRLMMSLWHWLAITGLEKDGYVRYVEDSLEQGAAECYCCDHYRYCSNGCPLKLFCKGTFFKWRTSSAKQCVTLAKEYARECYDILERYYFEQWPVIKTGFCEYK